MAETTKRTTPAPLQVSARLKTICVVLMFVGAATFAVMLMKNPERAWHGYLAGYFYFFSSQSYFYIFHILNNCPAV